MIKSNLASEILSIWDQAWLYLPENDMFFYPADGYFAPISAKAHLFRSEGKWATVFEATGYHTSSMAAIIQLFYFGNCLKVNPEFPDFGSNLMKIELCSKHQLSELSFEGGTQQYWYISELHQYVRIRGIVVEIDKNLEHYRDNHIMLDFNADSPPKIDRLSMLRLQSIQHPQLFSARMDEIRIRLEPDLHILMTLDDWYHSDDSEIAPSEHESYQLMAQVLSEGDPLLWKPQILGNLHWTNWPDAGNL